VDLYSERRATGLGPIAETFLVPAARPISRVCLAEPEPSTTTAENFTVTLDAYDGVNYDVVLYA